MGRRNLVQAALKEGLVVSPFKLEVPLDERPHALGADRSTTTAFPESRHPVAAE